VIGPGGALACQAKALRLNYLSSSLALITPKMIFETGKGVNIPLVLALIVEKRLKQFLNKR
jgi:hypothetical protein